MCLRFLCERQRTPLLPGLLVALGRDPLVVNRFFQQKRAIPKSCFHRWSFVASLVDGQLYSWMMTRRRGQCVGCTALLDAELEVQRTIKRARLMDVLCFLRKAVGPTMVHVDNQGIPDGLWRGETKHIVPEAKNADLWILIWEGMRRIHQEGTLPEIEHVKVRSKKENNKFRSSKSHR